MKNTVKQFVVWLVGKESNNRYWKKVMLSLPKVCLCVCVCVCLHEGATSQVEGVNKKSHQRRGKIHMA